MRIRDHFGLNDAANSSAHDDAFSADPEDSSSVALTLSSRGILRLSTVWRVVSNISGGDSRRGSNDMK